MPSRKVCELSNPPHTSATAMRVAKQLHPSVRHCSPSIHGCKDQRMQGPAWGGYAEHYRLFPFSHKHSTDRFTGTDKRCRARGKNCSPPLAPIQPGPSRTCVVGGFQGSHGSLCSLSRATLVTVSTPPARCGGGGTCRVPPSAPQNASGRLDATAAARRRPPPPPPLPPLRLPKNDARITIRY